MRSTFMGLETNKRGLYTQQSALYTTGHNISNANTDGYSRQRVNMQPTGGYPGVGMNSGAMPGFLGTGVEAGSIQRIRDSFVDHQFRQEANKLGYWESQSRAISQMEDVLNEPSHYGLQKSLSQFWQSLEDLAVYPENEGARKVAIQSGVALTDSFHYIDKTLKEIQGNINQEIKNLTLQTDENGKEQQGHINSILKQVADLNDQISKVEPNGYMPNDLYDARDVLLDELSMLIPIEVAYEKSGGRALDIAEGTVKVKLKNNGGSVTLVEKGNHGTIGANFTGNGTNPPLTGLNIKPAGGGDVEHVSHDNLLDTGRLKSLINSYGVTGTNGPKGTYPDMIAELNQMAKEFAEKFNDIHKKGTDLKGNQGTDFFGSNGQPEITAENISVSKEILNDASRFAASDSDFNNPQEGNGKNAQALADLQFDGLNGLGGSTIQSFYQALIGQLGEDGKRAERMMVNTGTLLGAVEHRRASISSVSLDEEMTDMIKFQQAYNASARMITVIDETLDKIINGMGVAGR
ncbi:flagellar hook-associated protein FlgK [Sporosarcina ureilytica]|uniref:Flagellar hook-associated protein 1 n=1 Tax=Sporosarcina ureilytica TaxID=298596 RepID=A0A1D8JIH2_9BACL|nr:flagellar hook-associated protein FlgK [Sporosarcina ureilytica]AOV08515.1 flagellar hook-associated protein FlgK [Sporosarcina ureilytica]